MKKLIVILAMLLTINGNAQWVKFSNGIGNGQTVNALAAIGNNILAGTNRNGIYISTNNGTLWNQTDLNNKYVFSFATLGNNVFAGTNDSGVYISCLLYTSDAADE